MSIEEKTIYFTRGVPPTDAFPVRQLQECAATVFENYSSTVLQYYPAMGYLPLREWLGQRHGVTPEEIIISNGSLQLQNFLTETLTSPRDVVFVEKPTYDRTITTFRKKGLEVVAAPLEEDGVNIDIFEKLVKEKKPKLFYIIPDFQNPSGITTSLAKRKKIIALAEKYNFWILEDNPYRDLRYSGESIPPIFSLGSDRVFFFSSFSKLISPGMRVGYLAGSQDIIKKVAKIAEDTYITPNMLSQGIIFDYCQRGWMEPGIARLKDLYRPKLESLTSALEEYLPQTQWSKPEGGFFMGIYFPAGIDFPRFKTEAHQRGVILSEGKGFFVDDSGDNFLRLPFCALSSEEIREGVRRLGQIGD